MKEEGRLATDSVTDVTDVTDGRRKREEVNCQLPTANCQLSTANSQQSTVNY
ncbi:MULTISPECIES: hypothetical protein [unclassified Microcoleus]|uniref:hypothetical protein n=1 Tax=unclassified Microcoleus TaxID=2642155 RepID=UPI002FD3CEDC